MDVLRLEGDEGAVRELVQTDMPVRRHCIYAEKRTCSIAHSLLLIFTTIKSLMLTTIKSLMLTTIKSLMLTNH